MTHSEAAQKGRKIMVARRELKRELKSSNVSLVDFLVEPDYPDWLERMPLSELLSAIPYLRVDAAEAMLAAANIKLTANFGDPTYRKRRVLADLLSKWNRIPVGKKPTGRTSNSHSVGAGGQRSWRLHGPIGARTLA